MSRVCGCRTCKCVFVLDCVRAWTIGRPLDYINGMQCTLHASNERYLLGTLAIQPLHLWLLLELVSQY